VTRGDLRQQLRFWDPRSLLRSHQSREHSAT